MESTPEKEMDFPEITAQLSNFAERHRKEESVWLF